MFWKSIFPKRKNPTMLIKNVPEDVADSELLGIIRDQNPEVVASDECWNACRDSFVLMKFQHA